MKKILAFTGSPRPQSNSGLLLHHFMDGASHNTSFLKIIDTQDINLKNCRGCLRCNVLRRCSIPDDDWGDLSMEILDSDVLVFASPVYFHHLPAPLKNVIDRFRSFVHVQISETGLIHTPWEKWNKDFVLLLTMGSSNKNEAKPIIELFEFMNSILGPGNRLHVINATRLAMAKQITQSQEVLEKLYLKLKVPVALAASDHQNNQEILEDCQRLGAELSE